MRKLKPDKRKVLSDPLYNSLVITKLVNKVMLDGKKAKAQKIVYAALFMVEQKLSKPALEVFELALENIKPVLELKVRRIGGANYQIPIKVAPNRAQALAIRWLVNNARNRNGKTMILNLMNEIIDASNLTGGAVKKKEEIHRMADANKAFAHYRW